MRPLFADPKTDFVFEKIFGSEEHEPRFVAFLNHLLERDEAHRIVAPMERRPAATRRAMRVLQPDRWGPGPACC